MKNSLNGIYKREYQNIVSIIKHEVAPGKERDNVLEELLLLFQNAENSGQEIDEIFANDRKLFVDEIVEVLPKNKYKNIKQIVYKCVAICLLIISLLILFAFGYHVFYYLSPSTNIIGGAIATTTIQLISPVNGILLSFSGLCIVIVLLVMIIQKYKRLERK